MQISGFLCMVRNDNSVGFISYGDSSRFSSYVDILAETPSSYHGNAGLPWVFNSEKSNQSLQNSNNCMGN